MEGICVLQVHDKFGSMPDEQDREFATRNMTKKSRKNNYLKNAIKHSQFGLDVQISTQKAKNIQDTFTEQNSLKKSKK